MPPSVPKSFNEIYLDELKSLRPAAFEGVTAAGFLSKDEPDEARAANEDARAANLVELFDRVHRELSQVEGDGRANAPLAALCLSGGGIRSATFNLGVLQGLARIGLLLRFDYLSSVSGGGYIASWLKAWMYREGSDRVNRELARAAGPPEGAKPAAVTPASPPRDPLPRDPLAPEPRALDRLREYSNYLTPKVGLMSPDSWTAAALVIRNLILNWLVLVPLIAAAIAIPQAAVLAVQTHPSDVWERVTVYAALGLAFVGSLFVHWLRHPNRTAARTAPRTIVFAVVAPIYAAAALLALGAAWLPWDWWSAGNLATGEAWLTKASYFVALWSVGIPVAGWLVTELRRWLMARRTRNDARSGRSRRGRGFWWELAALILSGVMAGALLIWIAYYALCGTACGQTAYLLERPILFVMLALPTVLLDYLLARTLFVAIASLGEEKRPAGHAEQGHTAAVLDDFDREWWARLSGWVLALALGWLIFSAVTLIGGFLVHGSVSALAPKIVAALGGAAGIATAVLARSSATASGRGTNTTPTSSVKDISLKSVGPVFIVALVAYLALGTVALGRTFTGKPDLMSYSPDSAAVTAAPGSAQKTTRLPLGTVFRIRERPDPAGVRVSGATFWRFIGGVPALLVLVAVAFARVVNVNRYSMHGLYRNRLIRAYLGASNAKRDPDPFTGFATTDNIALHKLWRPAETDTESGTCTRPLPVINATLNLVTGTKRLAWQLRKAESFSMTPFYCGNFHEGYRETARYGGRAGISLGTAITISGAAANPNMGYHSAPTITFLMTLLNARLGAWLGNPNEYGARVFDRPGPKYALKPLIAELFGQTDSEHAYVNLSDGGHFDNLGLYEMVLRRCRYIFVVDSGRDPSAGFEDLGNAIRKIRIDFGIPIEFRKRIQIFPREEKATNLFCARADIMYRVVDGPDAPTGQLVYIKPALFGRGEPIPYDVLAYSRTSGDFPHESTTDQWFDEAQFESYRALGLHAVNQVTTSVGTTTSFAQFLTAIDAYIRSAQEEARTPDGGTAEVVGGPLLR